MGSRRWRGGPPRILHRRSPGRSCAENVKGRSDPSRVRPRRAVAVGPHSTAWSPCRNRPAAAPAPATATQYRPSPAPGAALDRGAAGGRLRTRPSRQFCWPGQGWPAAQVGAGGGPGRRGRRAPADVRGSGRCPGRHGRCRWAAAGRRHRPATVRRGAGRAAWRAPACRARSGRVGGRDRRGPRDPRRRPRSSTPASPPARRRGAAEGNQDGGEGGGAVGTTCWAHVARGAAGAQLRTAPAGRDGEAPRTRGAERVAGRRGRGPTCDGVTRGILHGCSSTLETGHRPRFSPILSTGRPPATMLCVRSKKRSTPRRWSRPTRSPAMRIAKQSHGCREQRRRPPAGARTAGSTTGAPIR